MQLTITMKSAAAAVMLGLVAAFGALTPSAAPAETELRLHTFVPPGHAIFTQIIEPLAEQIAEETEGAVTMTLYPSMQLGGKAPDLIRQAREGTVDMVFSLPGYTSAQFPRTQMIELPGLRPDGTSTTELMWDLLEGGYFAPEYDGLKVIALWAADDAGLVMAQTPVRGLDDAAGLLLRTPSAAQAGQIETMGATPVAIPMPQVYQQLERSVVDGALVPFTTILDFRLHEVADYFTLTGPLFGRSQFVMVMNAARYDSLAPEHQEVIDRLTGEALSQKATQVYLDRAAEATQFVREAEGKEVIEFSAQEQDRLRTLLAPIYEQWLDTMAAQGIDGAAMLSAAGVTMN